MFLCSIVFCLFYFPFLQLFFLFLYRSIYLTIQYINYVLYKAILVGQTKDIHIVKVSKTVTEYIYLNKNTAAQIQNKYFKLSVYNAVGHFQIC